MLDRKMTVTEASRHFADLVNRTYYRGESTILVRSGEPVAMVVPVGDGHVTGRDWMHLWKAMPHLDSENAEQFATDIEDSRKHLAHPASPWD